MTSINRIAVVTGAGGTLCSEMARELVQKGYFVAILGRTEEKLETVRKEIVSQGGTAMPIATDVADLNSVSAACSRILKTWGVPNVLINGAGGNQAEAITTINEFDPLELGENTEDMRGFFNLDMERFHDVLRVNTMGTVIPSQIFGREMARSGGGCIINVASMNSFRPLSRVAAYGIAKAGISNFTQWLAAYLAPAKIRVNAIAPGFFLNERSRKLLLTPGGVSERGASILRQTPMKSFGEASQLLGCMNWLIDDEASGFVTGIVVPVDGGFLACSGI
jgi:NAD(P)-dependent dehydrogenase (short-subunit alcohol dehydrogenase family)